MTALFNPKTPDSISETSSMVKTVKSLNSETPGDSKNAFLHWGDVVALDHVGNRVCY
jgi:hypothetical protein